MLLFGKNQVQASVYRSFYCLIDASSTPTQFTVVSTLATFLISLGWLVGLGVKNENKITVIKAVFSFFGMQTLLKNLPGLYQTCLKFIQKDPYKDCKTLCKSAEELYNNQLRLTMKAKSEVPEFQVPSYSEDIKYGKSRKLGRTEELMKYMEPFELGAEEELQNKGIAKPQPLRKKARLQRFTDFIKKLREKDSQRENSDFYVICDQEQHQLMQVKKNNQTAERVKHFNEFRKNEFPECTIDLDAKIIEREIGLRLKKK
jgi:hypothetical protein